MKMLISIGMALIFWSQAQAFTLNSSTNSNLKGWDNGEIRLLVNTANCPANVDVVGVIQAAAEVWNNVPTSTVKVTYDGATTSTSFSSPTTVYCETNFQAVTHADQNYVPGAAAVVGSTGTITHGILYLNASSGTGNIGNFDQTTLTIILAHEIGHVLGLGHSESPTALMYFDASAKTELSLAQDDMDGVTYLYPADETKGKMAGCGLVKNSVPPSGPSRFLMLVLLMLPLFVLWKLRLKLFLRQTEASPG